MGCRWQSSRSTPRRGQPAGRWCRRPHSHTANRKKPPKKQTQRAWEKLVIHDGMQCKLGKLWKKLFHLHSDSARAALRRCLRHSPKNTRTHKSKSSKQTCSINTLKIRVTAERAQRSGNGWKRRMRGDEMGRWRGEEGEEGWGRSRGVEAARNWTVTGVKRSFSRLSTS